MLGTNQITFTLTITLVVTKILGDPVSPGLRSAFGKSKTQNVMVTFKERPKEILQNLRTQARDITDRGQQIQKIVDGLESLAEKSQTNAQKILESDLKVSRNARSSDEPEYTTLWITNQMSIKHATQEMVDKLAASPEILEIREVTRINFTPPKNPEKGQAKGKADGRKSRGSEELDWIGYREYVSYALTAADIPKVWEMGYDGKGIRIAVIDNGVNGENEILKDNFVGANHHGWYDPTFKSKYPANIDGDHGTSVLSCAVGHEGVGSAPGAKWMACRCVGLTSEDYTNEAIIACLQWALCPHDYLGNNRDCSKAPHVLNLSFGGDDTDKGWLREAMDPFIGTTITVVAAAGNGGPKCEKISFPAAFPEFLTSGMYSYEKTDAPPGTNFSMDLISSPGPTEYNVIKPDMVMMGDTVPVALSHHPSFMGINYGTSFSTPYTCGVIALMLQKNPKLTPDQVKEILHKSSVALYPCKYCRDIVCGDIPEDQYPNHRAGYGGLNALMAIQNTPDP